MPRVEQELGKTTSARKKLPSFHATAVDAGCRVNVAPCSPLVSSREKWDPACRARRVHGNGKGFQLFGSPGCLCCRRNGRRRQQGGANP